MMEPRQRREASSQTVSWCPIKGMPGSVVGTIHTTLRLTYSDRPGRGDGRAYDVGFLFIFWLGDAWRSSPVWACLHFPFAMGTWVHRQNGTALEEKGRGGRGAGGNRHTIRGRSGLKQREKKKKKKKAKKEAGPHSKGLGEFFWPQANQCAPRGFDRGFGLGKTCCFGRGSLIIGRQELTVLLLLLFVVCS